MKSILSTLSLAGLAAAHLPPCSLRFVTKTEIEQVTVTVFPHSTVYPISEAAHPTEAAPEEPITLTTEITSTVTVTASPAPYYPIANGTSNTLVFTATGTVSIPVSAYPEFSAIAPEDVYGHTTTVPVSAYPEFTAVAPDDMAEYSTTIPAELNEFPATSVAKPVVPAPTAPAQAGNAGKAGQNKGEATFYGGNVGGGTCSFNGGYTLPAGTFGTALAAANWAGAGNCGACVAVTGPNGKTIKAMIVDQCPECGNNNLDLFEEAFAQLADKSKGRIPISWDIVPCGISSPLILKNKEGTSKYWFSMQVMNSNVRVSKLEVSTDGGKSWKATTRQSYNFFEEKSGFGTTSVDVKVTSVSGQSIVVKGVSVEPNKQTSAGSNFS